MLHKNYTNRKFYFFVIVFILSSVQVFSQVNLQWIKLFNPGIQGGNWTDANFIHSTTDKEGNVYITGPTFEYGANRSDIITIKYNTDGDSIWGNRYNSKWQDTPNAIAVDGNNNVIIAGMSLNFSPVYYEALLIKYSPNGDTLWTRKYIGSAGNDGDEYNSFNGLVLDSLNNIYVTGSCNDSGDVVGNSNCLTIKYDESGNQIWLSKLDYGYSYYSDDFGRAICLDPTKQYCYVAAHCLPGLTTIKYDCLTGDSLWAKTSLGDSYWYWNVTTDNSGNIFVASSILIGSGGVGGSDYWLLKYSPTGDILWSRIYSETLDDFIDYIRDMKVDSDNNVYVTGESHRLNYLWISSNWSTIKYDASGNQVWTRVYSRSGALPDEPCGLEIDKSGNILVGGYGGEPSPLGCDYILIKYDHQSGVTLDTYFYYNLGDQGSQSDLANTMAMDTSGNIFIAGTINDISTSTYDFGIIKLSPAANTSTLTLEKKDLNKTISDLQNTSDTILVNIGLFKTTEYSVSDINIIIDSVYHTNDSDLELYLIHLGITDTLIFSAGADGDNFIRTTLDDSSPLLLETGISPFSGTYKSYSALSAFNSLDPNGEWILKIYDNTTGNTGTLYAWKLQLQMSLPTSIESTNNKIPAGFFLNQNYPNPFNPSTKIKYSIPQSSNVIIKVFDILGNEIAILMNEEKPAGTYELKWNAANLPSGVYFYQLRAGNFTNTKKMVLLR